MTPDATIDDLSMQLWHARGMDDSPAKCEALEEIVRLADLRQDLDMGYQAREALVQAATFSGAPDKALVAFSWCLSQVDQHPDRFPEGDLMWKYKWIVNSLSGFPQISKQQMNGMLDDLQARYERAGAGLYTVVMLRGNLAVAMGDKASAKRHFAQLKDMPRDHLSDCSACVEDHHVGAAVFLGEDEKALAAAAPILAGRFRCTHVPHRTYCRLLLPLVRLKRAQEAARMHQTGYRLASKSPKLLRSVADHLEFLAVTDNLAKGVKLLEKHLIWALEASDLVDRFHFYRAGRFLMERLTKAGMTTFKARLPRAFPLFQDKGHYEVAELHTWFVEQSKDLAGRFDQRNGNKYFTRCLSQLKQLHALATPYPLK